MFVIARHEAIYGFCHCERSEAIHVSECTALTMDCRVAALLAMTGEVCRVATLLVMTYIFTGRWALVAIN